MMFIEDFYWMGKILLLSNDIGGGGTNTSGEKNLSPKIERYHNVSEP